MGVVPASVAVHSEETDMRFGFEASFVRVVDDILDVLVRERAFCPPFTGDVYSADGERFACRYVLQDGHPAVRWLPRSLPDTVRLPFNGVFRDARGKEAAWTVTIGEETVESTLDAPVPDDEEVRPSHHQLVLQST
jgi:hypothetical protein